MINKKGFTLVELLGVITILAVLALIAIPTIDTLVTKNKTKLYNSQIEAIKDGLKTWGDSNASSLPEDGEDALLLNLGILKLAGFVDEDIKNPNTDLCFSNDMKLSIAAVKEGYSYYVDEESGLDGNESDCSLPTTTQFLYLKGSNAITLAMNNTYEDFGFVAINENGAISSSKVVKVIKDKDGTVVDSIDTTINSNTPYTITYTYGGTVLTRVVDVIISDPIGTQYIYDYTGAVQSKELKVGTYKLEVWGAQGGYRLVSTCGGYGGYSKGEITLTTKTILYIYVGGSGTTGGTAGGFNGGGSRSSFKGGGGATDIRIGTDSLYSRVIVAGGGGSDGATSKTGMYGGGTSGGSSTQSYGSGGYGGTQTSNNWYSATHSTSTTTSSGAYASFGYGGNGIFASSGYGGAGGGGWYGGSGSVPNTSTDNDRGGGGGSGWIYTAASFNTWQTGSASAAANWLLNSSYYLSNSQLIAGNAVMPTKDGTTTRTGNVGNGYVKITKIS